MQETSDPSEFGILREAARYLRDLIDGRHPRFPKGLCAVAAKVFHQAMQAFIRDVSQVCRCMAGIRTGTALALEQRDPGTLLFKQVSGGDAGEPAADDDHVNFKVVGERGELRK